jgi:deazaflavin-dependent oxidoreductase (nitroreductase family)
MVGIVFVMVDPLLQPPQESSREWVREHAEQYVATDGADGHIWKGVPTLLLTTVGRRSGNAIRNVLIYGEDEGRYVIVASRGGTPQHPSWYLNLVDHPEVLVQVGPEQFRAVARPTEGAERERLWGAMTQIWPDYNEYQKKTTRTIPVVVLERTT